MRWCKQADEFWHSRSRAEPRSHYSFTHFPANHQPTVAAAVIRGFLLTTSQIACLCLTAPFSFPAQDSITARSHKWLSQIAPPHPQPFHSSIWTIDLTDILVHDSFNALPFLSSFPHPLLSLKKVLTPTVLRALSSLHFMADFMLKLTLGIHVFLDFHSIIFPIAEPGWKPAQSKQFWGSCRIFSCLWLSLHFFKAKSV